MGSRRKVMTGSCFAATLLLAMLSWPGCFDSAWALQPPGPARLSR